MSKNEETSSLGRFVSRFTGSVLVTAFVAFVAVVIDNRSTIGVHDINIEQAAKTLEKLTDKVDSNKDLVSQHNNDLRHFKAMCHSNRDAIKEHEKACATVKERIDRLEWGNSR